MGEALAAGLGRGSAGSLALACQGAVTHLSLGEGATTDDAGRSRIIIEILRRRRNVRPFGEAEAGEKRTVDERAERLAAFASTLFKQLRSTFRKTEGYRGSVDAH